ncbi:MAG: hypothetical protein M3044_21735, partial [Thermoproteota archaeon]|nr:hypothetical protein [Thermoproteota archaeon]
INKPRPLTEQASEDYIRHRREQVGVNPGTTVHHSFRRFYETEMQEPRTDGFMNVNYMRLLMGQKPEGLGKHYNKPPAEKLLPHYMKYMYRVTIDQLPVVQKERDELKKGTSDRITKIEQNQQQRDVVLY